MKLLHHLLLLLPALAGACASTAAPAEVEPQSLRMTYRDYRRGGQRIELVSETHTGFSEQYSQKASDPFRKVLPDAVMVATAEHFDDLGFAAAARPGRAPGLGSGAFHRSFEVDRPGATLYLATGAGSTREELDVMNRVFGDFMQLYNATQSFQVVDNPMGEFLFDDQKQKLEARNRDARD